jgi:hypothetical protein
MNETTFREKDRVKARGSARPFPGLGTVVRVGIYRRESEKPEVRYAVAFETGGRTEEIKVRAEEIEPHQQELFRE